MRSSSRRYVLLAVLCLLLPAGMVLHGWAQQAPATVPATLPQAIRDALSMRQAWLQALTPAQRAAFVQRLTAWDALPHAQREDRRARYLAWQALLPDERARLQVVANEVAALPAERQQALRQEFAALEASQRAGWRLGMALGKDYPGLYPLLAYVPDGQRLPLLAALQAMTPEQRVDLAVLAQRTPPQQRQALREELLATPATGYAAWLSRKMNQ